MIIMIMLIIVLCQDSKTCGHLDATSASPDAKKGSGKLVPEGRRAPATREWRFGEGGRCNNMILI